MLWCDNTCTWCGVTCPMYVVWCGVVLHVQCMWCSEILPYVVLCDDSGVVWCYMYNVCGVVRSYRM